MSKADPEACTDMEVLGAVEVNARRLGLLDAA